MDIPDQSVEELDAISLDVTSFFDDADGDTLSYSATAGTASLPAWLTFDAGVFSGTPPLGAEGFT